MGLGLLAFAETAYLRNRSLGFQTHLCLTVLFEIQINQCCVCSRGSHSLCSCHLNESRHQSVNAEFWPGEKKYAWHAMPWFPQFVHCNAVKGCALRMIKNRPAPARSKSMNSIHQILETVVSDSLVSEFNSVEVNEKLQRIQDHLKGRNIPPVTTVTHKPRSSFNMIVIRIQVYP